MNCLPYIIHCFPQKEIMQEVFFLLYEVEGESYNYVMTIICILQLVVVEEQTRQYPISTNGHDLDQCFRLLKETSKMTQ